MQTLCCSISSQVISLTQALTFGIFWVLMSLQGTAEMWHGLLWTRYWLICLKSREDYVPFGVLATLCPVCHSGQLSREHERFQESTLVLTTQAWAFNGACARACVQTHTHTHCAHSHTARKLLVVTIVFSIAKLTQVKAILHSKTFDKWIYSVSGFAWTLTNLNCFLYTKY